jgi:hypothetical protein
VTSSRPLVDELIDGLGTGNTFGVLATSCRLLGFDKLSNRLEKKQNKQSKIHVHS